MNEPRIIVLGTVTRPEGGEALAFPSITPDMDPAAITATLEQVEKDRLRRETEETRTLRTIFLPDEQKPADAPAKARPIARDWLVP